MDLSKDENVQKYQFGLYFIFFIGTGLAISKFFFKDTIPIGINEMFEHLLLLFGIMCSNYCILVFYIILLIFNSVFILRLIGVQIQQKIVLSTSQMEVERKYAEYMILLATLLFNIIACIVCFYAYREYKNAFFKAAENNATDNNMNFPL